MVKCRDSEKPTLQRAVATWNDLKEHCDAKKIDPSKLATFGLEQFIFAHHATTRAYVALRWLAKNLMLPWHMGQISGPSARAKHWSGMAGDQATPAEPVMVQQLEKDIELAGVTGSPSFLGYLASWLQAMGCVRLQHVKRSVPTPGRVVGPPLTNTVASWMVGRFRRYENGGQG